MRLRNPDLAAVANLPRAIVPDILRWAILGSVLVSSWAWLSWGQAAALPGLVIAGVFAFLRLRSIRVEMRTYSHMEIALDASERAVVLSDARRLLSSVQRRTRIEAAVWSSLAELAWREGFEDDALALCDHVLAVSDRSKVGRFQAFCLKGLVLGLRNDVAAASQALAGATRLAERLALTPAGMAQLRLLQITIELRCGRVGEAKELLGDGKLLESALDAHRQRIFEQVKDELADPRHPVR